MRLFLIRFMSLFKQTRDTWNLFPFQLIEPFSKKLPLWSGNPEQSLEISWLSTVETLDKVNWVFEGVWLDNLWLKLLLWIASVSFDNAVDFLFLVVVIDDQIQMVTLVFAESELELRKFWLVYFCQEQALFAATLCRPLS